MIEMLAIVFLAIVFVLIAVRQVGRLRLQIWQIMLVGAAGVLVTGQISPVNALAAIDPDVMLFLFGMFIVGQALEESGFLGYISHRFFSRARSMDSLVILILLGAGLFSAFLMNDTLAIVGTPVMLLLARKNGLDSKPLLLALAFAVTIGSVASPIGNPQNLLIALNGNVQNPFVTFARYLFLPTVLNLLIAYIVLKLFYPGQFKIKPAGAFIETIKDQRLSRLCVVSLVVLFVLVGVKVSLVFIGSAFDFKLTYIALAAALPVVIGSPRRIQIVKNIDWCTLIFFAAMFVLMRSVWDSGVFQGVLAVLHWKLDSIGVIFAISVLLSQLISNVPLVALYLPLLLDSGGLTRQMVALAAGSTIAGNLSILGAASNIIIIQNAESKAGKTLTFWDFLRVGFPLTVINVAVYWVFLELL